MLISSFSVSTKSNFKTSKSLFTPRKWAFFIVRIMSKFIKMHKTLVSHSCSTSDRKKVLTESDVMF